MCEQKISVNAENSTTNAQIANIPLAPSRTDFTSASPFCGALINVSKLELSSSLFLQTNFKSKSKYKNRDALGGKYNKPDFNARIKLCTDKIHKKSRSRTHQKQTCPFYLTFTCRTFFIKRIYRLCTNGITSDKRENYCRCKATVKSEKRFCQP